MVKVLSADQSRACDAFTIAKEPVSSLELMERACRAFTAWFTPRYDVSRKIGVVCGTGNNGGDGLGIARLLREWGYPVKVWIVRGGVNETADFAANLQRLAGKAEVFEITSAADQGLFTGCDVMIDALFGSGISRAAEGLYAQAISCINKTQAARIAVDVPSGLLPDSHTRGPVVCADHTVSFQLPKLAFMFPENYRYVGEWHMVDIGLNPSFLRDVVTPYFYVSLSGIRKILKPRSKFDNKGSHGKALIIAGSYGKMGACVLATRAALRAGVGLATAHVPALGYSIVQTAVPEAMVSVDTDEKIFTSPKLDGFDAIGIGPGIGQDKKTQDGLEAVLGHGKPLVIDADALNILSVRKDLLRKVPPGSIFTPHPKEFERLVGGWTDDFDRLEKQKQLSRETGGVIVLKGAHTSIATPEGEVYFNSTGNPGMATGGTGDVLTGIVTGLRAQGYSAPEAAVAGVYLHGASGDIAKNVKSVNTMIASDLIDYLPQAFKKISG
jgi:hydroxyethylthiazole kinase-like uncharacterized protein yjeF